MSQVIVSSGYNDIFGTPLADGVTYAGTIVDRNMRKDVLPFITNTTVLDNMTRCGSVVTFQMPATVGPWRPYEKNQALIPDQPSADQFCLSICNAAYKAIKIDKLDIRRACEKWASFEVSFLKDVWANLSLLWHTDVFTGMQAHTSARNMGKQAGRYGNIDLGTVGNAVALNPGTIVGFLSRMRDTLADASRWYEGEMFIVVPRAFSTLLMETMFAKQVCCDTSDSVLFRGMKAEDIQGFTIVQTDYLRPIRDPATKKLVYPIIAGWNEAYAFTGDIVEAGISEIPNSFGIMYKMQTLYGSGAICPEGLAKAYVTFDHELPVPN